MIAASRPVTRSEMTVKMPSLMPAAIVVALRGSSRRLRRLADQRSVEERAERAVLVGGGAAAVRRASALTIACSPALPE